MIDTSEESKENSRKELERLGGEDAFYGKQGDDAPGAGLGGNQQILGGHKATLSNPSTFERDDGRDDRPSILTLHRYI